MRKHFVHDGEGRLPRELRSVREHFVEGNRVQLLRDGAEVFPAMLKAIAAARERVLLEMYWFASDRVGQMFAEALLAARGRGVEVALIYDAIGSLGADASFFDTLRAADIHVMQYNPIAPWRQRFALASLSHRDHRKLLVVDDRIGFTGGMNLANPWLPTEDSGQVAWRDDAVQVEGPAVLSLSDLFFETWERQSGLALAPVSQRGNSEPSLESFDDRVQVLGQGHIFARRDISKAYRLHIYRAQKRIWLTNSYFVPDPSVMRALRRAARRGVDVRVLVPGTSDVPAVNLASRATWADLLKAGVRIFRWSPSVLHAKTAVIDGHWSTLGSFNLDYLSLRSNLEVNVAIEDYDFGRSLEDSFLLDLEKSTEVTYDAFQKRPFYARLIESLCYRLRKFL